MAARLWIRNIFGLKSQDRREVGEIVLEAVREFIQEERILALRGGEPLISRSQAEECIVQGAPHHGRNKAANDEHCNRNSIVVIDEPGAEWRRNKKDLNQDGAEKDRKDAASMP